MANVTELLPVKARPYAKAVFTLLASIVGAVLLTVDPEQVPDWLQVVAVVLGVTGSAYGPRNDP